MNRGSITIRLLAWIVSAFVAATVCILFLADTTLRQIINHSQDALYEEKLDAILGLLGRSDERLRKTGLVEAYTEEFQTVALNALRQTYYVQPGQRIYPFILDGDGKVVLHPELDRGNLALEDTAVARQLLGAAEGSFASTVQGEARFYVFQQFQQWNWVVAYVVPLDLKYADARRFRNLLVVIMAGTSCAVLLVLSLVVTRFTRPIVRLTHAAKAIADGKLDHPIDPGGKDEVGVLAASFGQMRDSVRATILELQEENRERRQAEERLAAQNEYVHTILESLTHPFYAIDIRDYTIRIANSASGFHAGDHSTCHAVSHGSQTPCAGESHPCPLDVIRRTRKPTMVEHVHLDPDGKERTIEVYAYPVFGPDGELVQMIEYNIDISDRKRAQRELAEEKERLSVTLRSIGDGVITTDTTGRIVLLNMVAEKLTGWNAAEAAGRSLEEVFRIVDANSGETCANPATAILANGCAFSLASHTMLLARDGAQRNIADSGAPIRDAQNRVIGVVLVFRDVTDQLRTEAELIKIKKLESIGVLAGGIAHDFNNILAAILGNINLALFNQNLEEKTRHLLSEAEKASLRARDLTQQLLTFAKGGEPVKESSSLESVIKDSANFILHGDTVVCRYDIPPELWLVDIDRGQISQVIQNVVLNASHAMPEGGVIQVTCENLASLSKEHLPFLREGRYVKITIRDSGIGMTTKVLEKIFDPYFSTKQEGSGLGLAIARSVVNKHGGHITAESTPGIGSAFRIYLPCSSKSLPREPEAPAVGHAAAPVRVLVMDDEEMVRDIAREMLAHLGHEVAVCADGKQAIARYREALEEGRPFDLIFVDLTVPGGMGGQAAVREILDLHPEARVIVSSGYSNDPVMAKFRDYGFCAAIVKPYRMQDLSALLETQRSS